MTHKRAVIQEHNHLVWQEKLVSEPTHLERKHWNDHLKEVRLEVHGPPT
jgi:hypothetical protein